MQNPIPKLRQNSIISKKPAFLSKNWKLWRAPTMIEFDTFCWNFAHVFYLVMSLIALAWFFLIYFRSWVIHKSVKRECVENRSFLIFANTSRSKQNKRNPAQPFVDIVKYETCAKFQQKTLNRRVVGARQIFQIFRQNTWFLENNRALSKFLYGILHLKSVHKKQFYFNQASHPKNKMKAYFYWRHTLSRLRLRVDYFISFKLTLVGLIIYKSLHL